MKSRGKVALDILGGTGTGTDTNTGTNARGTTTSTSTTDTSTTTNTRYYIPILGTTVAKRGQDGRRGLLRELEPTLLSHLSHFREPSPGGSCSFILT